MCYVVLFLLCVYVHDLFIFLQHFKGSTGHTHTHTTAEQTTHTTHEHRASNGATTLNSRRRRRRPQAAAQRCAFAWHRLLTPCGLLQVAVFYSELGSSLSVRVNLVLRVVVCGVVLVVSCSVWCCSCHAFVCVTCFSSYNLWSISVC